MVVTFNGFDISSEVFLKLTLAILKFNFLDNICPAMLELL